MPLPAVVESASSSSNCVQEVASPHHGRAAGGT
jgi:hypothetical protein